MPCVCKRVLVGVEVCFLNNNVCEPDPSSCLVFEKRDQDLVVAKVRGSHERRVAIFVRDIQVKLCITWHVLDIAQNVLE